MSLSVQVTIKSSKSELLAKVNELGILHCKSKSKSQLLELIHQKTKEPPLLQTIYNPLQEQEQEQEQGQKKQQSCAIQSTIQSTIQLYKGDANIELDNVEDKTIQTVCIDPPYNIGKDVWDNIDNYVEWLTKIVVKLEKKMRTNGSMFIFHNDMEQIAELMISLKSRTKLVFRQMIVWNKRFDKSKKKDSWMGLW